MKTDAMNSFNGGSGMAATRMDCTGNGMGSAAGNNDTDVKSPFRKKLDEVTSENVAAYRSSRAVADKKEKHGVHTAAGNGDEENGKTRKSDDCSDVISSDELLQLLTTAIQEGEEDGQTVQIADDVADNAEEVVREVLTALSEALGISIFGNLDDLSLTEVGKDTCEQFAEIVATLKKMLQAFEFGREQGIAIELPSGTMDGEGIDALSDTLRVSVFKIEVACSMLGIGESVQKQVEVQMDAYQTGGIIQATDPSTISMARQHTDRLFGGLFSGGQSTSELAELTVQVKKLLAENGGDASALTIEQSGKQVPIKGDLQQFDATVYRAMLKIDKEDHAGQQNGEAVHSGEKQGFMKAGQPVIPVAKDPAAMNTVDQSEAGAVQTIQPGMPQNVAPGNETRLSGTLMRMTDETVMEQITDRLQSVVRSGASEVRIQLRPESLGEVTIRIRMDGDVVLTKIEVQNQQVKEIMERNLPMLKDALAQQNITAGSFDVQVNNGTGRHFGNMPNSPWSEEETAQNSFADGGREEEQGYGEEERQYRSSDTGRRFGSNSVEYFA